MPTLAEQVEAKETVNQRFLNHPAYRCLRMGDVAGFNRYASEADVVDLADADLRGLDLRKVDLRKVVLHGAYLREVDLRGQDLRGLDLEGCSLRCAKVSGAYFPANVRPEEILMSLQHGTRIRTTC